MYIIYHTRWCEDNLHFTVLITTFALKYTLSWSAFQSEPEAKLHL